MYITSKGPNFPLMFLSDYCYKEVFIKYCKNHIVGLIKKNLDFLKKHFLHTFIIQLIKIKKMLKTSKTSNF